LSFGSGALPEDVRAFASMEPPLARSGIFNDLPAPVPSTGEAPLQTETERPIPIVTQDLSSASVHQHDASSVSSTSTGLGRCGVKATRDPLDPKNQRADPMVSGFEPSSAAFSVGINGQGSQGSRVWSVLDDMASIMPVGTASTNGARTAAWGAAVGLHSVQAEPEMTELSGFARDAPIEVLRRLETSARNFALDVLASVALYCGQEHVQDGLLVLALVALVFIALFVLWCAWRVVASLARAVCRRLRRFCGPGAAPVSVRMPSTPDDQDVILLSPQPSRASPARDASPRRGSTLTEVVPVFESPAPGTPVSRLFDAHRNLRLGESPFGLQTLTEGECAVSDDPYGSPLDRDVCSAPRRRLRAKAASHL